jgi:type IV pilus assembly protein PilB
MNKNQLSKIVAKKIGLDNSQSRKILDIVESSIQKSLLQKQNVSISNFGTFLNFKTKSRAIPNPKNPKQKIVTLGKNVVKFKASDALKQKTKNVRPSPSITAEEKLLKIRTKPVKIPYIELKKRKIPKEILTKIPEHIARAYQIVPVEEKDGKLQVAMVNPEDLEAIEFVKKKTGLPVLVGITTGAELSSVLDQYAGLAQEIEKAIEAVEKEEKPKEKKGKEKKPQPEIELEAPTARLVNSLIVRAVKDRASDIHIEPQEKELDVRFRIDGVLQKAVTLPKEVHPSFVARVKILANLKIDETRIPQDGRFSMKIDSGEVDFRVSTLPTVLGEKVVMRILDKSKGVLTLEELGVRGRDFKILEENIHKAHGMTLITGPTGSGKTTTLYAVLDRIYNIGINIVTLEDPVEYRMPGINQSQVNPNVNFSFATGLRSIVRQDPDVIMLGEVRDTETASMAIHAALTGHVVLSTLHTNDAAGAIPRLIDMKVEPFLIASSLNLVVAQRLCRRICENCKETQVLVPEILSEIQNEIKNLKLKSKKLVFYKGRGCNICNQSGYKGRIGIFEVLPVNEVIKDLIIKRASADQIATQAIKDGMTTLKQDGIKKAIEGLTSVEEVWRVTKE